MNIISCEGCGVILDGNVLPFAESHAMYKEDGSINQDLFEWSYAEDDYVPKCNCPVCNGVILKE